MVNVPNLLTLLRLVLLVPVLWLVHTDRTALALGGYVMLLATDALDGFAARKLNQETSIGEYLDFVVDFICYFALIGYFVAMGRVDWWNIGLILVATLVLVWVTLTLARKTKRLYMPHRASSKVLAAVLSVALAGFVAGIEDANTILLVALGVIYVYPLPDYLRFASRHQPLEHPPTT